MRHLRATTPTEAKPTKKMTAAAIALEAALAGMPATPATKRKPNVRACLASAKADVDEMMAAKRWAGACGRHFVALFAWLHEEVYGVAPEEIYDSRAYAPAVACASRMLAADFGGDGDRMLAFLRWVWARERATEKRRTDGRGRRITWQLLFASRSLIVDYRVALVREGVRAET